MISFKSPIINIKSASENLCIDLESVKNFLRIDFNQDDNLIARLIKTATKDCELYINKTITEKTYVYSIYEFNTNIVKLPFQPIKNIISIKIINLDTNIEMDNDLYYFDSIGGLIQFNDIPKNFYRIDIEYNAGFDNISDELIQGILMHIAVMYDNKSGEIGIPENSLNIYRKYKQIKL